MSARRWRAFVRVEPTGVAMANKVPYIFETADEARAGFRPGLQPRAVAQPVSITLDKRKGKGKGRPW